MLIEILLNIAKDILVIRSIESHSDMIFKKIYI